jgi:hypothetical protein
MNEKKSKTVSERLDKLERQVKALIKHLGRDRARALVCPK